MREDRYPSSSYPYTPRYFWRFHVMAPNLPPVLVPFDPDSRVYSRADALDRVNKWNASVPQTIWKYWIGADETKGPNA